MVNSTSDNMNAHSGQFEKFFLSKVIETTVGARLLKFLVIDA